jgi:ADP-ribose pyrophosphatase YjhB (NUDIX family)
MLQFLMSILSLPDKKKVARLVSLPPMRLVLALGVRAFVSRQRTGVSVVCFDEDQRVLLLRHVFHPAIPWGLPGGWLDRGESPADCAQRELREETGLEVKLGPVLCVGRESSPDHLGISFMACLMPGDMNLSSEIIEAKWYQSDDLPVPLQPFAHKSIRVAASRYSHWLELIEESYD